MGQDVVGPGMHPEDMELLMEEGPEAATQPATRPGGKGNVVASTQGSDKQDGKPAALADAPRRAKEREAVGAATQASTQPGGQVGVRGSGVAGATTQAATQASMQPSTQPSTQPTTQPSTQPTTQASTKPSGAVVLQPLAPVRPAWDHYQVIYQRNMFMQQRSGSDRGLFGSDGQVPKPPVTEYKAPVQAKPLWILTGVAVLDDDRMAFAENITTGQTTRARVGDKLGEMKVTGIAADGVELELEGKSTKVIVGGSLDGRSVDGVLVSGAAQVVQPMEGQGTGTGGGGASAGGATAGGPSAPGTSDEAAIRERLKRRRMEEGGK
jgi:hypothetical protein